MTHDVSIEIKKSDGKIIAIGQIALPEEVVDGDLLVTITTTELKEERNPLHPEALTLADLKVGMKIRVGSTVIPLVRLGDKPDYIMGYPKDMGPAPYQEGCRSWWNHTCDVASDIVFFLLYITICLSHLLHRCVSMLMSRKRRKLISYPIIASRVYS